MVDRRSSGLQRSPEAAIPLKTWENHPNMGFTPENRRQMSRDCSVDSFTGKQNCDSVCPRHIPMSQVPPSLRTEKRRRLLAVTVQRDRNLNKKCFKYFSKKLSE